MEKLPAPTTVGVQYGALPWRMGKRNLQILLITSRRTRRWIIPKGWPMEGCNPAVCAAREAEEEAGVSGEVGKRAVGRFRYIKLLRNGIELPCLVEVFPLRVTKERGKWHEKQDRIRRWCSVREAVAVVGEPQLRTVIRRFGAGMAAQMRHKPAAG